MRGGKMERGKGSGGEWKSGMQNGPYTWKEVMDNRDVVPKIWILVEDTKKKNRRPLEINLPECLLQ